MMSVVTAMSGRAARSWDDAAGEILACRGRQFDPDVVDAFVECESALRGIRVELAVARLEPMLIGGLYPATETDC